MIPPIGHSGKKSRENGFQEKYRKSKTIKVARGSMGKEETYEMAQRVNACCKSPRASVHSGTHMVENDPKS